LHGWIGLKDNKAKKLNKIRSIEGLDVVGIGERTTIDDSRVACLIGESTTNGIIQEEVYEKVSKASKGFVFEW